MILLTGIFQWIKQYKIFAVLLYFIFTHISTTAQFSTYNLVPNPSFENYDCCPINTVAAYYCKPEIWYKPDNVLNAKYYNSCANNNITGVPVHTGGGGANFQYAKTGNAYMVMLYYNVIDSRNYIQVELLDSLRQGKCYYAEYYVNLMNSVRLACNNQSMLFTNNPVYVDTANNIYMLPANPQIQNTHIITDTLNWVKISGVFIAQGGEKYLTLGNFKNDAQTAMQQVQTTGQNAAAYYIEDVSVLPLDSITLKADAGTDKTITQGDSVFIGSYTTGLTNVVWYNSTGSIIATGIPGMYVQPATSTFYAIEQTVCGQYSKDTVYVNVGVVPLRFINLTLNPSPKEREVKAVWQTANEINVSHFNVQRSADGVEFYTINKTTAKNNAYNEYAVAIIPPLGGKGGYYRIEAIDKDGKTTYSKTEKIQLKIENEQLIIYPNPATNIVNITCTNMKQVSIIDITGRTMLNKQVNSINNLQLNIAGIGKGIFLVRVTTNNGRNEVKKLIVQ